MRHGSAVTRSTKSGLSPRARELATQVEHVVGEFLRSYPDTRPEDVRDALEAAGGPETAPRTGPWLALSVAAGVAVLIGLVIVVDQTGGATGALSGGPVLWIAAALIAALVLGLALLRS